jgi:hypothetical protein
MTMQELFEKIQDVQETKVTEITLSYLEIYNETIRDLLVEGGSTTSLMLREDANQAVSVAGLTSHRPQNVRTPLDVLNQHADVFPGPRSHGHHRPRQRVPNNVPNRSQRNLITIARRPPDQCLFQGPQCRRKRAPHNGYAQHYRLGRK